jgi:nitronate monooxygenase
MRKAYVDGDLDEGSLAFGQVCGLINDIPTCQELIDSIITEAEDVIESIKKKTIHL